MQPVWTPVCPEVHRLSSFGGLISSNLSNSEGSNRANVGDTSPWKLGRGVPGGCWYLWPGANLSSPYSLFQERWCREKAASSPCLSLPHLTGEGMLENLLMCCSFHHCKQAEPSFKVCVGRPQEGKQVVNQLWVSRLQMWVPLPLAGMKGSDRWAFKTREVLETITPLCSWLFPAAAPAHGQAPLPALADPNWFWMLWSR